MISFFVIRVGDADAGFMAEVDCGGGAISDCKIGIDTSPGTTVTCSPVAKTESELPESDPRFEYLYGLIQFQLESESGSSGKTEETKILKNGPLQGQVILYFQRDDGTPIDLTGFIYRKYGPTPDNLEDHWYDFMYDGQTGAVIDGPAGKVTLYFIEGQRGDDDLGNIGNETIIDQGGPTLPLTLADSVLFPWVVRSDDVTTVISVVNTAQTWAESVGLPFHNNRIHVEYWHKKTTANDQEEKCIEYNFEVTSSKDDMVTWDMAGHFNGGLPMFNDTSNEVIGVPDMTLAVENPRRAFLIVDNYTDALNDAGTNVDGTMYGEATIIEHKTGAAWGYVGYNAVGGYEDFSDESYRDQQGEVIGASETTQTTLLNPNDATTKLFITPTYTDEDSAQRKGILNTRVQLCRFPERNGDGDPYTGDCTGGGIWNNEEGGFSFTTKKEIVCTTADNIVDFFGGAGSSAYTQWVASGKAGWAYLVTQSGNIDNRDGTAAYEEADEAIIGKLEYGTGLSWDGSIADTINTFVWLRDNANYLEHCEQNPDDPRCDPGGVNIIHNEYYQERGACCTEGGSVCIDGLTEGECNNHSGVVFWGPDTTCYPGLCG
jgi:hypothetical protein